MTAFGLAAGLRAGGCALRVFDAGAGLRGAAFNGVDLDGFADFFAGAAGLAAAFFGAGGGAAPRRGAADALEVFMGDTSYPSSVDDPTAGRQTSRGQRRTARHHDPQDRLLRGRGRPATQASQSARLQDNTTKWDTRHATVTLRQCRAWLG